jgi:TPR repeat protein
MCSEFFSKSCVWSLLLLLFVSGCATNGGVDHLGEIKSTQRDESQMYALPEFKVGQDYFLKEDYSLAAEHWKIAATQGSIAAWSNLGFLTYHGMGVIADPEKAVQFWHYAADRGFAEAHRHLATANLDGRCLQRNTQEAYARFKASIIVAEETSGPYSRLASDRGRKAIGLLRDEMTQVEVDVAEALAIKYATQRLP